MNQDYKPVLSMSMLWFKRQCGYIKYLADWLIYDGEASITTHFIKACAPKPGTYNSFALSCVALNAWCHDFIKCTWLWYAQCLKFAGQINRVNIINKRDIYFLSLFPSTFSEKRLTLQIWTYKSFSRFWQSLFLILSPGHPSLIKLCMKTMFGCGGGEGTLKIQMKENSRKLLMKKWGQLLLLKQENIDLRHWDISFHFVSIYLKTFSVIH